jgi:hypothetical protein
LGRSVSGEGDEDEGGNDAGSLDLHGSPSDELRTMI